MRRVIFILGVMTIFIHSACTTRKKEEQLEKRSAELDQKEQELLLKESSLKVREEELARNEISFDSHDSVVVEDTIAVYNTNFAGSWQVKMTCVENTCPGSAVGDIKNEQWNIEYQGDHIIAKANEGDKLVRVYSGLASGTRLELIQHPDSATMTYDTRMIVRLRMLNNQSIDGEREIIRENGCKIVYSLRMDKL